MRLLYIIFFLLWPNYAFLMEKKIYYQVCTSGGTIISLSEEQSKMLMQASHLLADLQQDETLPEKQCIELHLAQIKEKPFQTMMDFLQSTCPKKPNEYSLSDLCETSETIDFFDIKNDLKKTFLECIYQRIICENELRSYLKDPLKSPLCMLIKPIQNEIAIHIWKKTKKPPLLSVIQQAQLHNEVARCLYSPNGKYIALQQLWSIMLLQSVGLEALCRFDVEQPPQRTDVINTIAFFPDSTKIAASTISWVYVWLLGNDIPLRKYPTHANFMHMYIDNKGNSYALANGRICKMNEDFQITHQSDEHYTFFTFAFNAMNKTIIANAMQEKYTNLGALEIVRSKNQFLATLDPNTLQICSKIDLCVPFWKKLIIKDDVIAVKNADKPPYKGILAFFNKNIWFSSTGNNKLSVYHDQNKIKSLAIDKIVALDVHPNQERIVAIGDKKVFIINSSQLKRYAGLNPCLSSVLYLHALQSNLQNVETTDAVKLTASQEFSETTGYLTES